MRARNVVSLLAAGLLTAATSLPSTAQTAPPTFVRGSIQSVAEHAMVVKTRGGETVGVALTEPLKVLTVKNVDLASIGSGAYVGIATRAVAGGAMQAIEVLVFPEAMRGAGEGSRPWDLEPASTMTNGTVSGAVKSSSARELTVDYKGGSKVIQVGSNVPVVTFAPAERSDLKPGAPVFLGASKGTDGTLSASRVTVGKDGVAPPM